MDEEMMLRSIQLAQKGRGNVSPNPMVGCVIVKNAEIIGEGYHQRFGEAHAEVNAIRSATESVEGADVYVNLEPCDFYGKTPPCTDLLIEKRVKKVFVAMLDPNPRVHGKGVRKLRNAGIEVEVGLESERAKELNESFSKYVSEGLPFISLKVAQSLDGTIALMNGKSKYITSEDSLKRVHELRVDHDAVLAGAGTIKADDPELTVRLVEGRSPVRIILDGNLSLPLSTKVFSDKKARTVVLCSSRLEKASLKMKKIDSLRRRNVEVYSLRSGSGGCIPILHVLKEIASLGIASVLVEGGSNVFSQFIKAGLADKLFLFIAPKILGRGKSFSEGLQFRNLSEALSLKKIESHRLGVDCLITAYF